MHVELVPAVRARKADMKQEAVLDQQPGLRGGAHLGLELRYLRYLIAVADAGTFTQAAERIFVAQPTLSQQIRRLEEMVGTPLLQRRRDGVRLTAAGQVLLEELAWDGPGCGWSCRRICPKGWRSRKPPGCNRWPRPPAPT